MAKLEDMKAGCRVHGILSDEAVTLHSVQWQGTSAVMVTYSDAQGNAGHRMLFRVNEAQLKIQDDQLPWSFDADGEQVRLASEALRIHLAHLFDPYMAVHSSMVEPLPHQISAVYQAMLPKLPLRFVLADDPGAGKTIMTGLFLKELLIRGDLQRCLIVCPGSLAEQWQDELFRKFDLRFEILTNDVMEAAVSGNVFLEKNFCIARLDKLARNDLLQEKLKNSEWDLIVVDEAHKMSATVWGNEVKYTRRFQLGQLLSRITRNFLLLTATPHNGKEEDFRLFLSLLDPDRFEGAAQRGSDEAVDVSDIMRRLVKEELLKFDGSKLFPERRAFTVNYDLSEAEKTLYEKVTDYVRNEFSNADHLENRRRSTVGFALTILQRRLASSPEAIWKSLERRRSRLEKRLAEVQSGKGWAVDADSVNRWDDEFDEDELSSDEMENLDQFADQASAAQTVAQLEQEIFILKDLETLAHRVYISNQDHKWDELSKVLQDDAKMFGDRREKLIIFTEHRDTLNYLQKKLSTLFGSTDAVAAIHGGMSRDERHQMEELFKQDEHVRVLLATDAAGEGINLQRAHLMINYDLPWNPNRLEQRFGRIHRIGQTEVCNLWNLVARETREGDVFQRLFEKLEHEREALGGRVFDILGKLTFDNKPLKELLIEAIRYGNDPKRKAEFAAIVDHSLDREALQRLMDENALTDDLMDVRMVTQIREDMERWEARKLQPFFIGSFFLDAFTRLGGTYHPRGKGRWEIRNVPASVRGNSGVSRSGLPIAKRYARVCFDKQFSDVQTEFLCPGHPLLEAVLELTLKTSRSLLKQGTVFVDENDVGLDVRLLFYVESVIQNDTLQANGRQREVSHQLRFVEMFEDGRVRNAGYAPYLDYRPVREEEREVVQQVLKTQTWLRTSVEERAMEYATEQIVAPHYEQVRALQEARIDKIEGAVRSRLTREITYWDLRAYHLSVEEKKGKTHRTLNSENAARRADDLRARLETRLRELQRERSLSPLPPNVAGGALVIPAGLLRQILPPESEPTAEPTLSTENREAVEKIAMDAVMEFERRLGFIPKDVSTVIGPGYDIESYIPEHLRQGTETLRFIEVKGRTKGAPVVTVSKNEILAGKNKPEQYILALVEVDGTNTQVYYITNPFDDVEPGFSAHSVNFEIRKLLEKCILRS